MLRCVMDKMKNKAYYLTMEAALVPFIMVNLPIYSEVDLRDVS